MAIEIAPKKEVEVPIWATLFLVICLIGVLVFLGSYFYFSFSIKNINQKIAQKDELLKETAQEIELKKEVFKKEEKINSFSDLILNHKNISNIFTFLEKTTHPKIVFSNFSFNSSNNEIILQAKAENFIILGQEILNLKKENLLTKITLSGVSLNPEGKVDFSLHLFLNPQVYK